MGEDHAPLLVTSRIGAAPHGETRNRLLADLFEADHFLPAEGTMIEHSDFLAHDFTDPNLAPILGVTGVSSDKVSLMPDTVVMRTQWLSAT